MVGILDNLILCEFFLHMRIKRPPRATVFRAVKLIILFFEYRIGVSHIIIKVPKRRLDK